MFLKNSFGVPEILKKARETILLNRQTIQAHFEAGAWVHFATRQKIQEMIWLQKPINSFINLYLKILIFCFWQGDAISGKSVNQKVRFDMRKS